MLLFVLLTVSSMCVCQFKTVLLDFLELVQCLRKKKRLSGKLGLLFSLAQTVVPPLAACGSVFDFSF